MPPPETQAPLARRIMRLADKVALATIERETGGPFLSLTGIATLMDATPLLLLSQLSRHTQNLRKNPQASLLFDGTGDHANPLTENRVTLNGRIIPCKNAYASERFMARHPKAFYAGFADFDFYELAVGDAHFVGGFGTALTIPADLLLLPATQISELQAVEREICEHMNNEHAKAVTHMAVNLAKGGEMSRAWMMTGIDSEGCDFRARKHRARLAFPRSVTTRDEMRAMLIELAATGLTG